MWSKNRLICKRFMMLFDGRKEFFMKVRRHIYFSGMVQGVGFRYRSTYLAQNRDLTGWVKNLFDGRVEMEVQGEESNIERFLKDLQGQRFLFVEDMEMTEIPCVEESKFRVVY